MPAVMCSIDGCNAKLQPIQKIDPRDRETWTYPECDLCFRPVCEKHSSEIDGQIDCDHCRRAQEEKQANNAGIDLGLNRLSRGETN
jgi:hypothetical protein